MSTARLTVPGVYLITRKTIQGQYLLHPYQNGRLTRTGKRLRNHCGYVLAHYSQKYGIGVGAASYLSNHPHLVADDAHARLPDFERDHNAMLARFVRYLRHSQGAVWEPNKGGPVELTSAEAILDKLAYTIMQPVKDGLLYRVHHWDGLCTLPDAPLKAETFYKDEGFWRTEKEGGVMPREVVLQPKRMPGLAEYLGDDYEIELRRRCYALAKAAAERRKSAVLGRKVVRRISWQYVPKPTPVRKRSVREDGTGVDPVDGPKRIRPRFTYRSRSEYVEQVRRRREFLHRYRTRRAAYLAGDRDSPWPYGTYMMCRILGAPQASPD